MFYRYHICRAEAVKRKKGHKAPAGAEDTEACRRVDESMGRRVDEAPVAGPRYALRGTR
jgi:hypothetical protein